MNKIKKLFAVLLSLVCALALFACSGGSDGYYVEDSITANMSYYASLMNVTASVDFDVYLPKVGKYDIEYTLELYYNGRIIATEDLVTSEQSDGEETVTVHQYWDVYNISSFNTNSAEVRITNVTVRLSDSGEGAEYPTHYNELAIAFGVIAAAALGAIIALFVVFKKREQSAEK